VTHQKLIWSTFAQKKLSVYLRRDDLASEHYPGNKWYKLFYNLQMVMQSGKKTVLSFGGAYSNHIHALAAMGKQYGLNTVGIIRGYPPKNLSPTLQDARDWGMELLFLGHDAYRKKNLSQFSEQLKKQYGDYYCLPEGGDNLLGVKGCQAIAHGISQHFTGEYTVCCALGTGTTFAGIVSAVPEQVKCLGFSVLKGEDTLTEQVSQRLQHMGSLPREWYINNDFHHGGYAKTTPELLAFMQAIEEANNLSLEPVYSAKMLWGIDQLAQQNYWAKGSTIIAVHGGGLQGRRGFTL
jgi:1-aminocyclopropane-1-carboxylate deaminase